jgi:hypothetical protein
VMSSSSRSEWRAKDCLGKRAERVWVNGGDLAMRVPLDAEWPGGQAGGVGGKKRFLIRQTGGPTPSPVFSDSHLHLHLHWHLLHKKTRANL